MISMTTNHAGVQAVRKNISDMSLAELTREYNVLAARAGKSGVKKLRSVKDGVKRIKALGNSSSKKVVDERSKVSQEFDCRAGTNMERLVEALASTKGKKVERSSVLAAVYGSKKAENAGPLAMVVKGVQVRIKKGRLPYVLEASRDQETKESFLALLPK